MSQRLAKIEMPPIEVESYDINRGCMGKEIDTGYLIVRVLPDEPSANCFDSITLRDGSKLMAVPNSTVVPIK